MTRALLLIAVLGAACDDSATGALPDAGGGVDGAPWTPPDADPPPGPAVTLAPLLDINQRPPAIAASGYIGHAGKVYFGARRPGGDYALYVSDGTAAGTVEVASRPTWNSAPRGLQSAGGTLYFSVSDEVLGTELWQTDGQDAGTRVVAELAPGRDNGFYAMIGASGATVYWIASTVQGTRLWRTDGTAAGTAQITNLQIVGLPSLVPGALIGGKLYFAADDGTHGVEPYVSDGTVAGTRMIDDLNPGAGSSNPTSFTEVGAKIVFDADDGTHGQELWTTDGTAAGTSLVVDIRPGTAIGVNRTARIFTYQGFAYFPADDGTHGAELWRSDGTAAGTTLVADLTPGATGSSPVATASVGGKLVFTAVDASHGREVFVTTGTAASTALLADIYPGIGSSNATSFLMTGGPVYFVANDGAHGTELWRTDGTAAGTVLVADLLPGTGHGAQTNSSVEVGGRVYITGTTPTVEAAPFTSDGTAAGTFALITAPEAEATAASAPSGFVTVGDKLFFTATDAEHGKELWVRDATGVHLVRDVNPGPLAGVDGTMAAFGSLVAFAGIDATHGEELWLSDGTEAGTRLVKDLNPGTGQGISPTKKSMVAFEGKLYFFGNDGTAVGWELYATDGTAAATRLIANIDPRPNNVGLGPHQLGVYNGMLLFNAHDANSDGVYRYIPNGDQLVRLTTVGLFAESLEVAGGKVAMSIAPQAGAEGPNPGIYVTDGTAAGTIRIDTHRTRQLFGLGGIIGYFTNGETFRNSGALGSTGWVLDAGPPDSTDTSVDQRAVELGGALYFVGGNGTLGMGLWRTDLTTSGTRLVRALSAGITYGTATSPVRVGDYIYFAAGDGTTGTELWRSDGTTAGTQLVRDVWAGPHSGAPRSLAAHGGALYLSLDDGVHGAEPWRLTTP